MSIKIKLELYNKCLEFVDQRINNIQSALAAASESGNSETKNSAGDKHETAKAQMQLEQEKNSKQLVEAIEMKKKLQKINLNVSTNSIIPGSLVITSNGNFFISISAGKISVCDAHYIAVSPVSPIGSLFVGNSLNANVNFNGQSYTIKKIF